MKVEQDMKILQQLIATPPSGGAVVNVITIEKIQFGSDEVGAIKIHEPAVPRLACPDTLEVDEKFHRNLEFVLENLPKPRYTNLVRLMLEVLNRKFDSTEAAAEWVGLSPSGLYKHLRKYGMSKFKKCKQDGDV